MTPKQRAVDVARQHMKIARTDVELHQAAHTLALALGATRVEEGTIKALHAALVQMDHPLKVSDFGSNLLKCPRGQMGTKPAKVGHLAPGASNVLYPAIRL